MSSLSANKSQEIIEGPGHIDRLVGPAVPDAEKELAALVRAGGETPKLEIAGEKFKVREVEKTERDRMIIRLASDAADRLMREYGRDRVVEIPEQNLHLIEWSGPAGGYNDARKQQLAVEKRPGHDASLAADLFHELVHAKSYNALKVAGDGGREITYYRTGLETVSREGRTHFRNLNEAVVQTLTMRFFDQTVARDPLFAEELSRPRYRDEDPREREEGTYWFAKEQFRALVDAILEADRQAAAGGAPAKFSGRDEVEKLFFRASITGELLEVARAVEDVWGQGSFRRLGRSLNDFWRENIYKGNKTGGGLAGDLIELVKKPVRDLKKKCSTLINDDNSLVGSLFRGFKARPKD